MVFISSADNFLGLAGDATISSSEHEPSFFLFIFLKDEVPSSTGTKGALVHLKVFSEAPEVSQLLFH